MVVVDFVAEALADGAAEPNEPVVEVAALESGDVRVDRLRRFAAADSFKDQAAGDHLGEVVRLGSSDDAHEVARGEALVRPAGIVTHERKGACRVPGGKRPPLGHASGLHRDAEFERHAAFRPPDDGRDIGDIGQDDRREKGDKRMHGRILPNTVRPPQSEPRPEM